MDTEEQYILIENSKCKKSYERGVFISLVILKFAVSFIYTAFSSMKEPLVRFSTGYADFSVVNIIKAIGVLPASILFVICYANLVNRCSSERIFQGICVVFLVFLLAYGGILYPMRGRIVYSARAALLAKQYPAYSAYIVALYEWPHTLFFIAAELWSQIGIGILYWGTVNDVYTLGLAKRKYPIFIAAGSAGGFIALILSIYLTDFYPDSDQYGNIVGPLTLMSAGMIIVMLVTYNRLRRLVLQNGSQQRIVFSTPRLSFRDSIGAIRSDRQLQSIAIIVISAGISISLTETMWKDHVSQIYTTRAGYQFFMSRVNALLLLASGIAALLLGSRIKGWINWQNLALVMPFVLLLTSVPFLLASYSSRYSFFQTLISQTGMRPTFIVMQLGGLHVLLTKIGKYAFFDTSREMAYIPLGATSRTKGKAAVDMLGSRVGKAGAYVVYEAAYLVMGIRSIPASAMFIAGCLIVITAIWVRGIAHLNAHMYPQGEGTNQE